MGKPEIYIFGEGSHTYNHGGVQETPNYILGDTTHLHLNVYFWACIYTHSLQMSQKQVLKP